MEKCAHCGKKFRTVKAVLKHLDETGGTCGDLVDCSGEDNAINRMENGISECETTYIRNDKHEL